MHLIHLTNSTNYKITFSVLFLVWLEGMESRECGGGLKTWGVKKLSGFGNCKWQLSASDLWQMDRAVEKCARFAVDLQERSHAKRKNNQYYWFNGNACCAVAQNWLTVGINIGRRGSQRLDLSWTSLCSLWPRATGPSQGEWLKEETILARHSLCVSEQFMIGNHW